MNLLQNAITRLSWSWLENLAVMSLRGSAHITKVFFTFKFSVATLKFREGQLDASCNSQVGPCHHSMAVDSEAGSVSLDMRSAGLAEDVTCLHVASEVASWMRVTRILMNVFQREGTF
jgi:hypothetical protein